MTAVVVAVPARNEAGTIAACLASLDGAAARTNVPVTIVLAADSCLDDTVEIAHGVPLLHCSLDVIEGRWRSAGRTRRAAVEAGLAVFAPDDSAVWIANTDADCVVPAAWLQRQLRHAARGKTAVAGTVMLDPATTPEHLLAEFVASYRVAGESHRHVHAANLGVRADGYRAVGGWSSHTIVGEDHDLWRRLRLVGADVAQPTDLAVVTSSRTTGRVVGGFASTLARLDRHVERSFSAS